MSSQDARNDAEKSEWLNLSLSCILKIPKKVFKMLDQHLW